MAILARFDVHSAQITFDALNRERGEVLRGRIRAAPEPSSSGSGASAVRRSRRRRGMHGLAVRLRGVRSRRRRAPR